MKLIRKIQYKHPSSIWEKIKEVLEVGIINDEYKELERIPSISELAEMYNIGKSTSKKVLETMFEEGTISKKQGVGYFVKHCDKEQLREKYIHELKMMIEDCSVFAKELDINKRTLIDFIEKSYDNIE